MYNTSVFLCPSSFARIRIEETAQRATSSPEKERAPFSVLMKSQVIYMPLKDSTEKKNHPTPYKHRLSTNTPASLWNRPPSSSSRFMTSTTTSPSSRRLSTVPASPRCLTSVRELISYSTCFLVFLRHI